LARFGRVVHDERYAGAARRFAIERRRIQAKEARARIMDLEFMTGYALAPGMIDVGNLLPIQFRHEIGDWLAFHVWLQAEQALGALEDALEQPLTPTKLSAASFEKDPRRKAPSGD